MEKIIFIFIIIFYGCKSNYIPKSYYKTNEKSKTSIEYKPLPFIFSCLFIGGILIYTGSKINEIK